MNKSNHRCTVESLLGEWQDNPTQQKNIINCLVTYLSEDITWLCKNISKVDSDCLIAVGKYLENNRNCE